MTAHASKKDATFSCCLEGDFADPFIELSNKHPNGRSGLARDIICAYLAKRSQRHFAEAAVFSKPLEHKEYKEGLFDE